MATAIEAPAPGTEPVRGINRRSNAPTSSQLLQDPVFRLGQYYWLDGAKHRGKFNADLLENIYKKDLESSKFNIRRCMVLEFSRYLENYLWPFYSPVRATKAYVITIAAIVNEKFRENVPAWNAFLENPYGPTAEIRDSNFEDFLRHVMKLLLDQHEKFDKTSFIEKKVLIQFLDHCYNSLEVDMIRNKIQHTLTLNMWVSLIPGRLKSELSRTDRLRKLWKTTQKKHQKLPDTEKSAREFERHFLSNLIQQFLLVVEKLNHDTIKISNKMNQTGEGFVHDVTLSKQLAAKKKSEENMVKYCERFLEFVGDLEARLTTRRWFNTLLDDSKLVVRCSMSALGRTREDGHLFRQLLDRIKFYMNFEVNDFTGQPVTKQEMQMQHYNRMANLQRKCFTEFEDLRDFSLEAIGTLSSRKVLEKRLSVCSHNDIFKLCVRLAMVDETSEISDYSKDSLLEMLVQRHELHENQLEKLNNQPLYPNEMELWDDSLISTEYYVGDQCFALPKLGIQFLTLHDYMLRNFELFRLESAYEIRCDIEDQLPRLKPWMSDDGECNFGSWARMALPLHEYQTVEVARPRVGEKHPQRVRADITISTEGINKDVREEWYRLRKHDVVFLLTIRPRFKHMSNKSMMDVSSGQEFADEFGITYVRGCEIEGMLDSEGKMVEEYNREAKEDGPVFTKEFVRTYRVYIDPCQYQEDLEKHTSDPEKNEDVYRTFNVILRRRPKENNFKAVLDTIRQLMNSQAVVPEWLHDTLLGYGDPGKCHYTQMNNTVPVLNWNDTFLSMDHLRNAFPTYKIQAKLKPGDNPGNADELLPPYKLTFPAQDTKRTALAAELKKDDNTTVIVEPFVRENRGPYPMNVPKQNQITFTATQIEAIRSGMQPGLTQVVGPPGTGKTDVAVQIISNLYHNFPNQRTLLVTHSNQALNQLFEKIMHLDIDERHLLRLGHGEDELETEKDFSRYGRVNYVLEQRLELLKKVAKLQESLGVQGQVSYTCETAGHFYLYQIISRWEKYEKEIKNHVAPEKVQQLFPFNKFFDDVEVLFKGENFEEDKEVAEGCMRYVRDIFTQLEEFRAFELLRNGLDRTRYLLVKEAKIIAMTCTHAALTRDTLVALGFRYDNVLLEESAQILEIETFIPMLLQEPQDGYNRLKRFIMIGDHHQLPPVIKNMTFSKYSNMEQSLFARFIKLGVPSVQLDAQGRARSSICDLYRWRYKNLGDLPHCIDNPMYQKANPGLRYEYQLIDVGDFNGQGESEPNPHFYQNLAEAEYICAMYMYMRLLGYPRDKISILTTYNGQKHLIRDVVNKRCADNPLIGKPHVITTVDKYQGSQNDYILLSLVKTKTVGHIRDVRRLIVALSRARLGLYVFARVSLFQNCYELSSSFDILTKRPLKLQIVPSERYSTSYNRHVHVTPEQDIIEIQDMPELHKFVYDMYMIECERIQQEMMQKTEMLAPPEDAGGNIEEIFDVDEDEDEEQLINYELQPDENAFELESKQQAERGGESDGDDVPDSGKIGAEAEEEDSDMDEEDLRPPGAN